MKHLLILLLLSTQSYGSDFYIEKKSKNSYNIYDRQTGNIYYGKDNGKRMTKIYPKTIVDDENILYPRGYSTKGPYDGDPYSNDD